MTRSLSDEENQDTEYSDDGQEEEDHISESSTHLDDDADRTESSDGLSYGEKDLPAPTKED